MESQQIIQITKKWKIKRADETQCKSKGTIKKYWKSMKIKDNQ